MARGSAVRRGFAAASVVLFCYSSAHAGSHLWRFSEFYSSPDRSVQFIEMYEIGGSDNEVAIANHWYETDSYNHDHSALLGTDLAFGTANKKFLVGTQSYAALSGVPAPDYVLPDGILDPTGDTVVWWFYQTIDIPPGVMPTDGVNSITVVDALVPSYSVGVNSPTNFAGETGTVVLGPTPDPTPSPTPLACAPSPVPGCRAPVAAAKSQLLIRNDAQQAVQWLWTKGVATTSAELGNPLIATDYVFCVYDESGTPTKVYGARAPAGGVCGATSCWKGFGNPPGTKGYRRTDKTLTGDVIQHLRLRPGADGKARMTVKSTGAHLTGLPALPLGVPVRAQLQAENGLCWEGVYSTPTKNDDAQFKAKSD